jgi:hypothetical protein
MEHETLGSGRTRLIGNFEQRSNESFPKVGFSETTDQFPQIPFFVLRQTMRMSPRGGNLLIWLWLTLIGCFIGWSYWADWKRNRMMPMLMSTLGLKSWGSRLPPELSLTGTPMAHASAVWNVMEGERNGIPFIVFDCRMGAGKSSWRRTVIAARSGRDVFATVPSNSSCTVDRCEDWMIFYAPRAGFIVGSSLMPIPELEARLLSLG